MQRRLFRVILAALAGIAAITGTAGATADAAAPPTPTRIVSLSPTATEMLFAVGADRQVIAVDDQSNYPKKAPHTSLSGYTPNVEAIAGYRPDLVVMSDGKIADRLHTLGIDVLVLPAATTLKQSYDQIEKLGAVTGHQTAAGRVIDKVRSGLAKIAKSVPKRRHAPTVYYELDNTYFSADSSSFIGQVLKLAGLKNIADAAGNNASGYPQLSAEFIVKADPTFILLADTKCCGQSAATVGRRPGFAQLTAVRKHHVVRLDDDLASRWGPRVVVLFRDIVNGTRETKA
jgi:iron complex transport system substrate-binding protein